ncbi:DMT family transporter [Robinsoniella peoriensis]|uniref:DMT family transporter n=1 Tax=Robinsoniella peoriensis TaxID=180332 RepID=UPI00085C9899|nr:DMT family transporter [Robinsoniella peoriensis]
MQAKFKIILSMAVFGSLGIFIKNIPLSSGEIALFRAVIAAISILLYKFVKNEKIPFDEIKKDLLLLFLSGTAMGFNWIFLFQSYRYTSVSIATLSYYFAPVIVMAVCPILFRENLNLKQIICFVMSTLGLVLVIDPGKILPGSNSFIGICFGLSAAVLYATVIILNKLIKNVTGIDRTLIQFFAAIIILFPYVGLTDGIHLSAAGTYGIINLLVVGIVHTGITYCLYFSSLKDLKGQEAAILSYTDPLVAIIVSVSFLGETISLTQILGGILILGFTLLNEIKSHDT